MGMPQLKLQDKFFEKTILPFIPAWLKPNHITVVRILLTPVVVLLAIYQLYEYAIPVFLFIALTDTIDGSLARVRGQITDWGKLYDPVADKLLIGSLVVVLVFQHLGVILGISIIFIEIVFIALGWYWARTGQVVQANTWGKMKMFLQILGVTLLLFGLAIDFQGLFDISETTFYLALIFAIISLFTSGV
jgi:CDP-diacylglycerol--glycerol-3-phosphate 3-phosphatidyltransferase